ncbi:MAG: UDP-3-O-(3-hydroxymyristoyl)glucosamine N-acyltransferase, partial [Ideonella sp.]|nr:UDP-3-O-(3-hydroxymyristoyl)glucosamine N-acyltransferase [Ideonella sp.]
MGDIVAALAAQAPAAELIGDPTRRITRIGPLEGADPGTLSFLSNPRYRSQLASTQAGCVIVSPAHAEEAARRGPVIRTADPYLYFAHLTQWWARRHRRAPAAGIHPSAVVEPGASVAPTASVAALAVIEAGAVVGERAVVGA